MFSSLRSRLWLSYAALIVVALTVVALIFVLYLLRNPLAYRQAEVKMATAQALLAARQAEWRNLPVPQQQAALMEFGREFQLRILLLNLRRETLLDSDAGKPPLQVRRLARLALGVQVLRDEAGESWLFSTRKLDDGYFLLTALPRPKFSIWLALTDELMPPLLWGGGLALGLALLLALLISRWVADPLQNLVAAAAHFSGGQIAPLPLRGPQEVRELLSAFNAMTRRVQVAQESQKAFVANVSHELKTPLTAIQGFAQALLDGAADSPETRQQAAQVIYDESARLHRLALSLLDLARLEAGTARLRLAPLDLPALLNAIAEKFSPLAQAAGLSLTLNLQPLPPLNGDGDRLAQVFTNLVENAIKFTPIGGKITLSAQAAPGGVWVTVQDTGIGIAPEAQPRVFERFYQADISRSGKKHGAGLGLAIAQEIIRAHSGKITLRSALGQGSAFSVFLPGSKNA